MILCVKGREYYVTSMLMLMWYHLLKCKGLGKGVLYFCIKIIFNAADDLP